MFRNPFNFVLLITNQFNVLHEFKLITNRVILNILHTFKFLPSYYRLNDKIWLEGLLMDWLQKSIFDKWVRRFLIHSSYLVSERILFDYVIRFYIDTIIWPLNKSLIFNFQSITNLLLFLTLFLISFMLLINLNNLYYVIC